MGWETEQSGIKIIPKEGLILMKSSDASKLYQHKKFLEQTYQFENDLELIWEDFENYGDNEIWSSKLKELIRKFQENFRN